MVIMALKRVCVCPSQVRNFSVAEAEYLHKYFSLTGDEFRNFVLTGRWVGNRMSSYSYSHRVKPHKNSENTTSAPDARNRHAKSIDPAPKLKVDSSRFRVGTTSQEHILLPFALAVLAERNIQPPEGLCTRDQSASLSTGLRVCYEGADHPTANSSGAFIFYGFGWDMAIDAFKVYYMFHGLDTVPQPLREKVGLTVRNDFPIHLVHQFSGRSRSTDSTLTKMLCFRRTTPRMVKTLWRLGYSPTPTPTLITGCWSPKFTCTRRHHARLKLWASASLQNMSPPSL